VHPEEISRSRTIAAAAVVIFLAACPNAQAAGAQSMHPFRQMDRDRNGTVSRAEFLQFMSRRFSRLDTNRNGKLEPKELRPLAREK
jgi:Ca2+-binding EF-hand superfamily protein